jgi:hypothetical protein
VGGGQVDDPDIGSFERLSSAFLKSAIGLILLKIDTNGGQGFYGSQDGLVLV